MGNIARKDKCTCGSGNMYKYCCLPKSLPKEKLVLKVKDGIKASNTHSELRDGKMYDDLPRPMAMGFGLVPETDIYPEIEDALEILAEKTPNAYGNPQLKHYHRLYQKLRGTIYHLNNFKKR